MHLVDDDDILKNNKEKIDIRRGLLSPVSGCQKETVLFARLKVDMNGH